MPPQGAVPVHPTHWAVGSEGRRGLPSLAKDGALRQLSLALSVTGASVGWGRGDLKHPRAEVQEQAGKLQGPPRTTAISAAPQIQAVDLGGELNLFTTSFLQSK